jgi:LmbE family N-acetylglucosaminyl deacetylase
VTLTFNSLKAPASTAVERAWLAVASILGRSVRVRAERLPSSPRVLAIAPHPDDETIGAGGSLALHRLMGDPVEVAVVTDGRRSKAAGTSLEERGDTRRREAERAIARLGVEDFTWMGHAEWEWDLDRVSAEIRQIVQRCSPAVIYAPCRVDGHPEHVRVAQALSRALDGSTKPVVRAYQIHTPLTPVLVTRAFDVSVVADTVARAMGEYRTQLETIARTRRLKRYSARLHGARSEAEVFWEMSAVEYSRVHSDVRKDEWRAYAGLGPHAFRDPSTFLIGMRARLKTRADSILR